MRREGTFFLGRVREYPSTGRRLSFLNRVHVFLFLFNFCIDFCHTQGKSAIIIHIFPPSLPPIPSLQVITECQTGFLVLRSNFSPAIIHLTPDSVYMLMYITEKSLFILNGVHFKLGLYFGSPLHYCTQAPVIFFFIILSYQFILVFIGF